MQAQTPDAVPSDAPLEPPASAVPAAPVEAPPAVAPAEPLTLPEFSGPASVLEASEAFIDATGGYNLGATDRSDQIDRANPAAQPPALAPEPVAAEALLPAAPTGVQVGPLAVGESGLSVAAPTVRDFYNRTVRPPAMFGNGNLRLIFPLALPAPITSAFGWRIHPISGQQRFHAGTDLGAPLGTPVIAAYGGRVAIADFLGGYGLAVTLSHGQSQTLYAHLSEIFVKPGEEVKQGAVIGRVGSTGNSTGPHLHFEVRQQTPEGWVALDAGAQLELALAQLVGALQAGLPPGSRFGELTKRNLTLGKVAQFTIPLTPAPARPGLPSVPPAN